MSLSSPKPTPPPRALLSVIRRTHPPLLHRPSSSHCHGETVRPLEPSSPTRLGGRSQRQPDLTQTRMHTRTLAPTHPQTWTQPRPRPSHLTLSLPKTGQIDVLKLPNLLLHCFSGLCCELLKTRNWNPSGKHARRPQTLPLGRLTTTALCHGPRPSLIASDRYHAVEFKIRPRPPQVSHTEQDSHITTSPASSPSASRIIPQARSFPHL